MVIHKLLCYIIIDRCNDGEIQFTYSGIAGRGVVEVCINGNWNNLCGRNFGKTDASILCRQLGFSYNGKNY